MTTPQPRQPVHYVTHDGTCQPATILRTDPTDQLTALRTTTGRPLAHPDPNRRPGTWHPHHEDTP